MALGTLRSQLKSAGNLSISPQVPPKQPGARSEFQLITASPGRGERAGWGFRVAVRSWGQSKGPDWPSSCHRQLRVRYYIVT